ncbi:MAG: RNA methyltransferase [Salibacteraceae bacterium]|nr:RNA methyltransferase [Salibacteraceae bacterium]|tara:strand:- start:3008 stop:3544 length:537 start_codon:yes stop_codon:yes gene_type:complete
MNKKLKLEELNRISVSEFKSAEKFPVVVVLDNIRSAFNIGSIFRTADALAIESVYLCGITATPPHREIYKTALGASESVDWKYFQNTMDSISELKKNGFIILSLEQVEDSLMLDNFVSTKDSKYALVVGNEVDGVMQEVIDSSDVCIEIPQYGTKHSYNVSVSAGIALWDIIGKIKRV